MSRPRSASLPSQISQVQKLPSLAVAQGRTKREAQNPDAWFVLARVHQQAGAIEQALQAADQALALDESDPKLHVLKGTLCEKIDDDNAAQEHFDKALALEPGHFEANLALSDVYVRRSQFSRALELVEAALRTAPKRSTAHSRKAAILYRMFRFTESMALFEELIKQDPDNASHWNNLANVRRDLGMLEGAEQAYRRAAALDNTPIPLSNRLTVLHYFPDKTAEDILAACKEWAQLFVPKKPAVRPVPGDRSPDRKLRVGMYSDGFRQHPVGSMTISALEELSRLGVEIYAYPTSQAVDPLTQRMMAISARWTPIPNARDEQFAQMIRNDEIDILIDLSGHNAGSRIRVMALEPAPVLVKWVGGLINTTGLTAIDYLLSDSIESPPGSDGMYTEKLIRMPDDYICYVPPKPVPDVGALPALRNGYVTFGCFNNPTKVNDLVLEKWAGLMHEVPGSRLFLKGGPYESEALRQRVLKVLGDQGISADRVRMEGNSKHYKLLECYNEVDVALDPWPYSGGLTTCEAMLMGVPVVTLPGPTFAGRHSATHLVNAGMPELVVSDWDEYRARVIELVSDLNTLSTIRSHLRQILLDSPVCDGKRFAGNLANALRAIWQRYCEGKAPAPLTLDKEGNAFFADEAHAVQLQHAGTDDEGTIFKWSIQRKAIGIDSGGRLLARPYARDLLELGALEMVVFDPASELGQHPLTRRDDVYLQANLALGDGKPATLYVCLDPKQTGLLEPLRQTGGLASAAIPPVLARLPIQTIALDRIEGLPAIDWVVLDDLSDAVAILANGQQALAQTLLIDVRLPFQPTHAGQPELTGVQQVLGQLGFSLYRLHGIEHGRVLAAAHADDLAPTATMHADALFLPSRARLEAMDFQQRMKLAFILHTAYELSDAAHAVLAPDPRADDYLAHVRVGRAVGGGNDITLRNVRTPDEARRIVKLTRSFSSWGQSALAAVVRWSRQSISRDEGNNTAHFVLTHALLAQGETGATLDADDELARGLQACGWQNKAALYQHWFVEARRLRARPQARISAILIANRFKADIVDNVKALRQQGGDDLQIVFVNNGAPQGDFAALLPCLDVWVELNGNSGAYVARNIGAIHAEAPILLFVDDDGLPEAGFVQAHLSVHASHTPASLRGACRPRSGDDKGPPHYHLGDKLGSAAPVLEGNVSFARDAFLAIGGWGDYVLFGHGGFDIGHRLTQHGYAATRQLYTPLAMLRHEYVRGAAHASEKSVKQRASWLLLEALGHTRESTFKLTPLAQSPLPAAGPLARAPTPTIPREVAVAPALALGAQRTARTAVGVPLYNEEAHVEETLQSLRMQDLDDVHFLVSDNGSTDRTLEIIRDVTAGDARFSIHQQPSNLGAGANFRFLFDNTRSDYFMWMGGHDTLSAGYLSQAVEMLTGDKTVSMVFGQPRALKSGALKPLPGAVYKFDGNDPLQRYLQSVGRLSNCAIFHALFRRKQASDLVMRECIGADHIFISHLLWKGKLAYLPQAQYNRRYFAERADTAEERITGTNRRLPIEEMLGYYDENLMQLSRKVLSRDKLEQARAQVQATLMQRYKHRLEATQ